MRKLAILTGAFSAGIFLAQYLLPTNWLLPMEAAAFVLALGRLFLPREVGRRVLLAGVGLALAFGYDWLYLRQIQAPMEALAETERSVTMTLCDYATPSSYGAKGTVKLEDLPGKVVYYGDESLLDLRPGQTVEDLVSFQSAAHVRDEDITTFTSKGVFLLAYRRGVPMYGEGTGDSPRWWPARLGQALRTRIGELFGGDTAGFLTAILTGDKAGLSDEAARDLSEAGLYHILAVSGMHCGFLLALVTLLSGRHRRRLTAAIALPLLAFYALLTGCGPSVVRACVMLAFLLAAPLFRRDSDGPTALTAALALILLQNPFAAASISLQLSFAAVAGLLWLTLKLNRLLLGKKKRGKVFRVVSVSFSATMGALVFTVPLSVCYFGILVLVSPISNLLCLWAASAVFLLGLPTVLVSFLLPGLGRLLGLPLRALVWYILRAAHLLARLPYHAVYFSNPYLKYWLAFAYLLFLTAWLCRKAPGRKYVLAAVLSAVTLAATVRAGALRYTSGDLDAVMLDVGQGASMVLCSGDSFALVDCGSSNSWYDAGDIAAEQLDTMGSGKLDYLILTHYDSDHVNGVAALLDRVKIGEVLLPDTEDDSGLRDTLVSAVEAAGAKARYIREETVLSFGESTLTVFPPTGGTGDNEKGLTVLVSCGDQDLLITGDMDSAAEARLLETYDLPDIEVLAAGHHGSKTSTSKALLEALTPETVCISVGSNSYGHPAEETLRRLVKAGCAVCRTDKQGSIHLILNRGT